MATLRSFGDTRRARRRQLVLVSLALSLAAILVVGGTAMSYRVGLSQGRTERARLLTDLAAQGRLSRTLAERAAVAEQEAAVPASSAAELRKAMEADAPRGDLSRLLGLLRNHLAAGVPGSRLEFALHEAAAERLCLSRGETRRLDVTLPATTQAAAPVLFVESGIRVRAEMVPGVRASGADPVPIVTLHFSPPGGEPSTASGVLPLAHAVVLNGRDYLFLARAGARAGQIELTARACDRPINPARADAGRPAPSR